MDEAAKPETEIRKAQNSVGAMVLPRLLADVSQNAAVNVEDQAVDEASEARKTAGPPRSSASPQRSAGVLATMNWSNG